MRKIPINLILILLLLFFLNNVWTKNKEIRTQEESPVKCYLQQGGLVYNGMAYDVIHDKKTAFARNVFIIRSNEGEIEMSDEKITCISKHMRII